METFRRIFFSLCCLFFILFAYWQLNDPDPWLWVSLYVLAAVLCAMAVVQKYPMPMLLSLAVLCLIGGIYLFPASVSEWVQQEWRQQDLSMKTMESEEARESFGLLIVMLVMSVAALFGWRSKRTTKTVSDKPARV